MKPILLPLCASLHADNFLDRLAAVESGGNNQALGKKGERGAWQLSRVAWADVNRERARHGLKTHPHKDAHDPTVAREYAAAYVAILRRRIGGEPSEDAVCIAWNRGVRRARESGFRREEQPRATRRFL